MTYQQATELIDFLGKRFRAAGLKPWYRWAVPITWGKLQLWSERLGYQEGICS